MHRVLRALSQTVFHELDARHTKHASCSVNCSWWCTTGPEAATPFLALEGGIASTAAQTASSAASLARTGLFPGCGDGITAAGPSPQRGAGLKPVLFFAGFTTGLVKWPEAGARRWLARTERTSRRSPAARCSCRQLRWHQQALEKAGDRCMKNNKFALHAALRCLQPYKMTNRVFPLLYG